MIAGLCFVNTNELMVYKVSLTILPTEVDYFFFGKPCGYFNAELESRGMASILEGSV